MLHVAFAWEVKDKRKYAVMKYQDKIKKYTMVNNKTLFL